MGWGDNDTLQIHLLKSTCIHTVQGFDIVNKAEIDVFLELSCFFDDPADVGNLISGSSAFPKSSLNQMFICEGPLSGLQDGSGGMQT